MRGKEKKNGGKKVTVNVPDYEKENSAMDTIGVRGRSPIKIGGWCWTI